MSRHASAHAFGWGALDLSGADEAFRARFWSKVDVRSRGCWEWCASTKGNGYGQFCVRKGVPVGAHRVSFALTKGPIPAGMHICHHCDNPACVRPNHLFIGTASDNANDMFAKGRVTRSRGVERANARLTEEAVREIRAAEPRWGLIGGLALKFGVSRTTIRRIRSGEKWRHVR